MARKKHTPAPRQPLGGHDIIYGIHACLAALANPQRRIKKVLVSRNVQQKFAAQLAAGGIEAELSEPRELDKQLGRDTVHQGICLWAEPLQQPALEDLPEDAVIVLLDQVTDPHNVGAILRSCAAFNVAAVITTARHAPQGSAVMTKAASGAMEHVAVIKVGNLAREMARLRQRGIMLIGLDSDADTAIDAIEVARPLGLVLGAEGKGLRRLTRENCDQLTSLPLPGAIKSLNVSNAAALALYAIHRR